MGLSSLIVSPISGVFSTNWKYIDRQSNFLRSAEIAWVLIASTIHSIGPIKSQRISCMQLSRIYQRTCKTTSYGFRQAWCLACILYRPWNPGSPGVLQKRRPKSASPPPSVLMPWAKRHLMRRDHPSAKRSDCKPLQFDQRPLSGPPPKKFLAFQPCSIGDRFIRQSLQLHCISPPLSLKTDKKSSAYINRWRRDNMFNTYFHKKEQIKLILMRASSLSTVLDALAKLSKGIHSRSRCKDINLTIWRVMPPSSMEESSRTDRLGREKWILGS